MTLLRWADGQRRGLPEAQQIGPGLPLRRVRRDVHAARGLRRPALHGQERRPGTAHGLALRRLLLEMVRRHDGHAEDGARDLESLIPNRLSRIPHPESRILHPESGILYPESFI